MPSEMNLNSFTPTSKFTKEINFCALSEISDVREFRIKRENVINGNGNVISKSSSSEGDTNSASRLLDEDHDLRNIGYVLLTPGSVNNITPINEITNTQDVMWAQMQNTLSKQIRKRYRIKNRFPKPFITKFSIIGFCCYSTAIKIVLIFTMIILICAIVFVLMALFLTGHINSTTENNPNYYFEPLWWQGSTFYEVFPASFKDSNGDGFGDIQGLREKVHYFKEIGIQAIRLNSIFSAKNYPHQYDNVIDFENVDPHIGKMNDFISLAHDLKKVNIKLILDINPTCTSDQHPWASHWLLNKTGEYQYFYVNKVNVSKIFECTIKHDENNCSTHFYDMTDALVELSNF